MKTLTLLLILSAFAASAQTIRIADNNANRPTGPNIFSTIQAAVDAAVAGDIVFVQPSLTSYGDVTINKQITLRGIGFNTGKDFAYSSVLNNINLTNRIDNTSNASGAIIEGIIANDIYLGSRTGTFGYTLQNVTVANCQVTRLYRDSGSGNYQNVQNLTIANCSVTIQFILANINQFLVYGCYFPGLTVPCGGGSWGIGYYFGSGNLTSFLFSNNIVNANVNSGFAGTTVSGTSFVNNNFVGGTSPSAARLVFGSGLPCTGGIAIGLYDVSLSNNLFFGVAPNSVSPGTFERNSFVNNLSFGSSNNALPPVGTGVGNNGSNNIINQDPLFINAPYNTNYSTTMNFNLQPSSPAKNAGSDGTDIGITGGTYPIASGNINLRPTATPVIMTFTPQVLVPQNQPVKSNIKAKAN